MENMKKKTWLEKEIAKIQKDYDITYYSDTEMETENLTEAQFYFVDEIMGEVIAEISYEIFLSGEFPDWKIEEIVKEVNENLGIDYHGIWGTDEAYDSYYDEDKEVVKARIHEAIDSEFDEHNDILREKIEEYERYERQSMTA